MAYIRGVRSRRCCALAIGLLVTTAEASDVASGDPQALIGEAFSGLESVLAAAAAGSDMSAAAVSGKRLHAIIEKHVSIMSLVLADARGKVIAEAVRDGQPGKRGRNVAGQVWFQTAGVKRTRYYGSLRQAGGRTLLLWAVPVAGETRTGGALGAKIDPAKVLETATGTVTGPFAVLADGKELFSHGWREGLQAVERQLTIPGLEGAILRVDPGALAKGADTVKPAAQGVPGSGVALPQAAISDIEAKKLARVWLPILAAVVAFLVIVLVVFVVQNRRGGRDERFAMDFGEELTETPLPAGSLHAARVAPGVSLVVPPQARRSAGTAPPVLRPTERMVVPPQNDAPGPVPAHRADPQTRTVAGATPVVTPELYEQLRAQITREVTDTIRAEMRKEMEAEQRRIHARAEVFYRTIQTQVEELIGYLGETETRWTELSAAVKNCGFKLKQAMDGLGQGKT